MKRCCYCGKRVDTGIQLKLTDPSGMVVELNWHVGKEAGDKGDAVSEGCAALDPMHTEISDLIDNTTILDDGTDALVVAYEKLRGREAEKGIRHLKDAIRVRRQPRDQAYSARIPDVRYWGLPARRAR